MTRDARLQFVNIGLSVCHLPQLNSVLPDWVFKFRKTELHLQDLWREGFAETTRLFRRPPVGEIRQGAGRVLDNDVLDPFLKTACPGKDAFDAGRVRRDHADRCEADTGCSDILVHRLEPVGRNLPGTRSHVGKNDGRTAVEMIDEGVEAGRSVNVDLGDRPLKKCFREPRALFSVSRSSSVTGISFAANHSARATMTPVLPTPPLPPMVKTTRFNSRHCSPPLLVRVRGSFSRKTKRAGFAFRTAGFALRAATRSSAGESAAQASIGGNSNCVRLRCLARTFTKEWRVLGATYNPGAPERGGRLRGTSAPCGAARGSVHGGAPVWSVEAWAIDRPIQRRSDASICGVVKNHGYPRRRLRPHSADDFGQVVGELF